MQCLSSTSARISFFIGERATFFISSLISSLFLISYFIDLFGCHAFNTWFFLFCYIYVFLGFHSRMVWMNARWCWSVVLCCLHYKVFEFVLQTARWSMYWQLQQKSYARPIHFPVRHLYIFEIRVPAYVSRYECMYLENFFTNLKRNMLFVINVYLHSNVVMFI